MVSCNTTRSPSTSTCDFLLIALWWGLLTGLGEGYLPNSYIWRDLMRAGVEIEPLLFLGLALLIIAPQRHRALGHEDMVRSTFLFSGLAVFACLSRSAAAYPAVIINLLIAVAGASLLAFLWFLCGPFLLRWQKRTLLILLALGLWCVIAFPIKQWLHERRETAKLPAASANAPNVLVIVVDTLRADHLSTYGYSRPTSPHLTQLAAQGTLFEDAIAPSSWTLPVHASLLTGLYPNAHQVDNDGALLGWDYPVLGDEFMARGYRTAAFSGNTLLFCRRRGFGRGFIHFEDDFQSPGSSFAQTFYGDLIRHLLFRLRLKRDLFGRRNAKQINQHALRWIDGGRQPFFVFLNYMDVHDPYRPPEPYLHRYTNMRQPGSRASEHWDWFQHLSPQQRQGAMDAYDGAINYVDDRLAELMDQLHRRGLDRNTLLVITSDHGESFGEHGLMVHGNALYRELIHVPLIVWGLERIPAGKRISTPVSLTSVPATLLEEAGVHPHPDFPGSSLARLWRDGEGDSSPPDPISELAQLDWNPTFPDYYGPIESVSSAHWHYIQGKFGYELFPCCAEEPEQLNLAETVIGQELAPRFQRELALAGAAGGEFLREASVPSTYPLDFEPNQLTLADFDNDGSMDILVCGRENNELALLLGNGKGRFQRTSNARRIAKEFMARHQAGNSLSQLCTHKVTGNQGETSSLRGELGDVNGDGVNDVLLSEAHGQSSWVRGTAGGRYFLTKSGGHENTQRRNRIGVVAGDIDGNGLDDFAFIDEVHDRVVFFVAIHPGVFIEVTSLVTKHPTAIGLADLNHDGRGDLVLISRSEKSVTVVLSSKSFSTE